MVQGREGFTIGDLVRVRYPSQLHPPGSPGMPGVYRITSGPREDGCYRMLATFGDNPRFETIHGAWLRPADGAKYHSVGRTIGIDTPWVDPVIATERAVWAEVGMGPDEIRSALFGTGLIKEED